MKQTNKQKPAFKSVSRHFVVVIRYTNKWGLPEEPPPPPPPPPPHTVVELFPWPGVKRFEQKKKKENLTVENARFNLSRKLLGPHDARLGGSFDEWISLRMDDFFCNPIQTHDSGCPKWKLVTRAAAICRGLLVTLKILVRQSCLRFAASQFWGFPILEMSS